MAKYTASLTVALTAETAEAIYQAALADVRCVRARIALEATR